jgi:acid phosphatase type 7
VKTEAVVLVGGVILVVSSSCNTPTEPMQYRPRSIQGVLVGASDIATCTSPGTAATARLLDTIPGTVFTAGDNLADSSGTYERCFAPYWGRQLSRMAVTLGERDYVDGSASAAFDYFGAHAGPRGRGFYSFDVGTWHVVVLNTTGYVDVSANSEQLRWLRADLAAAAKRNLSRSTPRDLSSPPVCTVALFDRRRFFQGGWGKAESLKPLWTVLYQYGVELAINGHDHFYERYAPQNPDGVRDPVRGVRQFIVGTGGRWLEQFTTPAANVEVRNNKTWGVLKVTLAEGKYAWQFVPAAGGTFTDSGTGTCH